MLKISHKNKMQQCSTPTQKKRIQINTNSKQVLFSNIKQTKIQSNWVEIRNNSWKENLCVCKHAHWRGKKWELYEAGKIVLSQ